MHQSGSQLSNVKRNVEYLHHDFSRKPMGWCYTALQIVVLLLEGLEGRCIIGDLAAALVVCGMKPRCTDSIWVREKQRQPLELCVKIRVGWRVISRVPAASEDGSEAAHEIPVVFFIEETEQWHFFRIGKHKYRKLLKWRSQVEFGTDLAKRPASLLQY